LARAALLLRRRWSVGLAAILIAGQVVPSITATAIRTESPRDRSPATVAATQVQSRPPLIRDPEALRSQPAPTVQEPPSALLPTIQYEEALAHEHDRLDLAAGGRVTVGYTPGAIDIWSIDGRSPIALPAGHASGKEMLRSRQGSTWTAEPAVETLDAPQEQPAALQTTGELTTSGAGLDRKSVV